MLRRSAKNESHIRTLKQLERRCRQALYRELVPRWHGTRDTLRAALRSAIRRAMPPTRGRIAWMLRVVREARFAAIIAGAILTTVLTHPASAGPPIKLTDITAGVGGFVIDGEAAGDQSGWSVSGAGDINGDGIPDVIVGGKWADPNGIYSGRSYVVFGKPDGTRAQLSDVSAGIGGFAIDGEEANDHSGYRVSGAGDVNGDGLDDLIVGHLFAGSYGRSHVVFGKASGTRVQLSDIAASAGGGFAIEGEPPYSQAGICVSGAGDVNGDGLADLIVGTNETRFARSYVVFGKTSTTRAELSDVSAGTGGFMIVGEFSDGNSGRNVSGAGDVNGDGLADLIIGNARIFPGMSGVRRHVVFGKTSGTTVQLSDVSDGPLGFTIEGPGGGTYDSFRLSGAGDVNGDGLADLITGAHFANANGNFSGRTWVIFGKADPTLVQLFDVEAGLGGFAIDGEVGNGIGRSVSGAGDINGDGLADLIIGAAGSSSNELISGSSFVVLGKTSTTRVQASDIVAGVGGFVIDGEAMYDRSGWSVSGAGDVNGDGLADLVIGGPYADPNGEDSGRSYVVFSPEMAAASGTYRMRTLPGDGAGGSIVPVTDFGDVARVKIDFSDDAMGSNFAGGASTETVVITRSKAGLWKIAPIADVADVFWWIRSNRVGFTDAKVTLKYLDSEIAGISGPESDLVILTAPTKSGPWVQLTSIVDTARNEISATVTGFGFFAIGNSGVGQEAAIGHWIKYE